MSDWLESSTTWSQWFCLLFVWYSNADVHVNVNINLYTCSIWSHSSSKAFNALNIAEVKTSSGWMACVCLCQLVYHDLSGRWSFGIYVGDDERVKCMTTEQMDSRRHQRASPSHGVYQQCYTSTVLRLTRLDTVSIRCLYGSRSVVMQPEFTFWGLIQLASTSHQHRPHWSPHQPP